MGQLADLRDGLQDADLVVGRHDGNQNRLVGNGAAKIVEVDQAIFPDRKNADLKAVLFQALATVPDGLVLGGQADNVVPLLPIHLGHALEGQVVGLGGAGGEDDLLGRCVDQIGNLAAGFIDSLFRLPAKLMIAARRVAIHLGKERQHLLEDSRVHRRRSMVIHINR